MVLPRIENSQCKALQVKWLQVVALLPEGAWRWQRELSSEARASEHWRGRVGGTLRIRSFAAGVGKTVTSGQSLTLLGPLGHTYSRVGIALRRGRGPNLALQVTSY